MVGAWIHARGGCCSVRSPGAFILPNMRPGGHRLGLPAAASPCDIYRLPVGSEMRMGNLQVGRKGWGLRLGGRSVRFVETDRLPGWPPTKLAYKGAWHQLGYPDKASPRGSCLDTLLTFDRKSDLLL